MTKRRAIVLVSLLGLVLALMVGSSAYASSSGKADSGDTANGRSGPGPTNSGPDVFNATDWFVSNSVGVGTDTPDDNLEVEASSVPFIEISATAASNSGLFIDNTNGANCVWTESSTGDLRITNNCSTSITGLRVADDNGFTGIPAANPLAQLQVGNGTVPPITAGASLLVEQGSASSMILKSTTGTESFFYQDVNNGLFGTATNTPMGIRTNNLNRMWITNDGLIGIGTNFPTSTLHVVGSLNVTGTKNFVQRNPENKKQDIVYAALEGPEAGTYTRGSGTLVDGVARIALPHHFGLVTERKSLTVQLTPRGSWSQLYVESLSPTELVVRSASGKTGQFDFLVQGVRKGFSDFKVIRGAREVTK